MPHGWQSGFYTTADVSQSVDINHKKVLAPQLSHSGGQNTANVKTETNDKEKQ